MFFDTHTHVNSEEFSAKGGSASGGKDDADAVIQRALDNSTWMVNVGTSASTSKQAVEIANKYSQGVFASVGLHPSDIGTESFDETKYEKLLTDKVVAVGECGLDYFRLPNNQDIEKIKQAQKQEFIKQLVFATKHDLAVIIHCRAAYTNLLEIMDAECQSNRVIIHSFTDTWDTAKKFLDRGYYIALNGILTFDKTGKLAEVAEKTPLEKLLTETDAPYLAPPPFRGKRNEPLYVQYVVQKIAGIKKLPVEAVGQQTFENARRLFKIKM